MICILQDKYNLGSFPQQPVRLRKSLLLLDVLHLVGTPFTCYGQLVIVRPKWGSNQSEI